MPAITENQMGGCQNYDPLLGTPNIRCRIILGIEKRDHDFDNHPYHIPSTNRHLQPWTAGKAPKALAQITLSIAACVTPLGCC